MAEERFKIIFEKLEELVRESPGGGDSLPSEVEALAPELDEIAELRRIVTEIMEPPLASYTGT